mmetsp:Transcript_35913/g.61268  ORF Transcript_35913/g.61268 Transcript_35913/m.61268 type:complete len:545 (-) Transcript_35913:57-1691(-)
MPKRGRSSDGTNPLSSARKDAGTGSGSKSGSNINKADRAAQSLWHRKSGAGYNLFIRYYGSQPMGVITEDSDFASKGGRDVTGGENSASGADKSKNGSSTGMSRAAKKRRKKKFRAGNIESPQQEPNQRVHASFSFTDDVLTSRQKLDASHPLIQAFTSTNNNNYPHLTTFLHALSRPLPLTLRFRENEQVNSKELKELLSAQHSDLISPVSYDPTNNIYQATPNSSLCKSNLGKMSSKLKEKIVEGSMSGTLARQELGSMLPVLCLRSAGAMKNGSKVLDLCASPGSKTLQALEIVSGNSSGGKKGKVIANDVHSGRLDSLREAVLRSGMPKSLTSRVTYTNYDASIFPAPKSGKLFDAIICDVPCGGDGTIRKDKHILPMWSPNTSNALHGLQLKILNRALGLVKVGGVICYSTCSLNPIEDEAVVSAALGGGGSGDNSAFELLNWPRNLLPGFVRRPGVASWKVAFYDQNSVQNDEEDFGSLSFFDSYNAALAAGVEEAESSFWPDLTKKHEGLPLDRCTRLFPQDQDTGGFFISLIKRIR